MIMRHKATYRGDKAGTSIPFVVRYQYANDGNITDYTIITPYFVFSAFYTPSCCGGAFIHSFEEPDKYTIEENFPGFDRGEWCNQEAADLCHAFITDTRYWKKTEGEYWNYGREAQQAFEKVANLFLRSKIVYIDAERFSESGWFKPDQMAVRNKGWIRHEDGLQTNRSSGNRILLGEYHTFDSDEHTDVMEDNND